MFNFLNTMAAPYVDDAHMYSFGVVGLHKKFQEVFPSRQLANEYMYKIAGKYHLQLQKVWDDHHFKTYCFTNGVKMFINRM